MLFYCHGIARVEVFPVSPAQSALCSRCGQDPAPLPLFSTSLRNSLTPVEDEDDRVHYLLAALDQPPGYQNFKVDYSNPLAKLIQKLPDRLAFVEGQLQHNNIGLSSALDDNISLGSIQEPKVKAMKSITTKSMYGKGKENVFDENVRK